MRIVILYALIISCLTGCISRSYKKTYVDDLSYIQTQVQDLKSAPCYRHDAVLNQLDYYLTLRIKRLK